MDPISRWESCSARVAEEQGGFSSASEFRSGATRKEGVASKRGAKNRRRSEIAVAPVGSLRDMSGIAFSWALSAPAPKAAALM